MKGDVAQDGGQVSKGLLTRNSDLGLRTVEVGTWLGMERDGWNCEMI